MTTGDFALRAGCSPRQLQYWDESGFLRPARVSPMSGTRRERSYSEVDLRKARVLVRLLHVKHASTWLSNIPADAYERRYLLFNAEAKWLAATDDADEVVKISAQNAGSVILVDLDFR